MLWAFYSLLVCACLTLIFKEICLRLMPQFSGWYLAVTGAALFLLFLIFLIFSRLRIRHASQSKRRKASFLLLFSRLYARSTLQSGRREKPFFSPFTHQDSRTCGERAAHSEGARSQKERFCLWDGLFLAGLAVAAVAFRLWSIYMSDGAWGTGEIWTEGRMLPIVRTFVCLLGIFLLYSALRILSGGFVAGLVAIGLSVLPFPVKNSLLDGRGNLFFFLFAFLALLTGLLCRIAVKPAKKSWPAALLTGVSCGAACGIDLLFAGPLLLCLSGVLLSKGTGEVRERIRTVCILLEAALVGFVLAILGQRYLMGVWASFHPFGMRYGIAFFEKFLELDLFALYGLAGLVGFSCLYIFGFFDQTQNMGIPWILPFLFLNFLFCVTDMVSGGQILFLSWLVFAAMGIRSMFCAGQVVTEIEEEIIEETSPLAERTGKRPVLRPGEPIPNPLPGPKKHVRRELDYAFIPEDCQMYYDLTDIDENDDFEL